MGPIWVYVYIYMYIHMYVYIYIFDYGTLDFLFFLGGWEGGGGYQNRTLILGTTSLFPKGPKWSK